MTTWTISRRLTAGFATVSAIVIGSACVFLFDLRRIDVQVTNLAVDNVPGIVISNKVAQEALNLRVLMLRTILEHDPAALKEIDQQASALLEETSKTLKSYEATITTPEDRANFERVVATF